MTHFVNKDFIKEEFNKGKSRGPDDSNILDLYIMNCMLGFHRLAINDLTEKSNQPFYIHNIFLVCNGEIYNYKELYELLDVTPETGSDCEIIIHLYLKYGMQQTIQMLDGEFAFILIDTRNTLKKLYVARDPYGVRPLYLLYSNDENYAFASNVKQLSGLRACLGGKYVIKHFTPGTFSEYENYTLEYDFTEKWHFCKTINYHQNLFGFHSLYFPQKIYENIREYFISAVSKRCRCTDRPVACLLSGGLDSSLVASVATRVLGKIQTFSIGFEDSQDLKMARVVADYLGSDHHEVIITKEDYLDEIPNVIQTIESYDTTTVRASVGNYLIAKHISQVSDAKVILNGDGSDELCGGYLYMHKCPDAIEFDKETRRLLKNIHFFDVLRSDKCISSNGLEARTPFLDLAFVQYYLSIHPTVRFPKNGPEKFLLRSAFKGFLPDEILWRTKEAFSDGVTKDSIAGIIHSHVEDMHFPDLDVMPKPKTLEEKYYRKIFEDCYKNTKIIPHFWKPNFVNQDIDPSARALDNYNALSGIK